MKVLGFELPFPKTKSKDFGAGRLESRFSAPEIAPRGRGPGGESH